MSLKRFPRLLLLLALWLPTATAWPQDEPLTEREVSAPALSSPSSGEKPAAKTEENTDRILPLEVTINGAKSGTWLLLERNGELYAPSDAFSEWRIKLPTGVKPIDFKLHDQIYWPLSTLPDYTLKMDFANQSAELTFSPEIFAGTHLAKEQQLRPVLSPVLPSAFLNYDANYQTTHLDGAPTITDLGVLTEVGFSNSWGVLTSSQAGRNLTNDRDNTTKNSWVRLETTYTRDFPEHNQTLRVGDSATRAGMWGRNVYFGGVQFGSNFTLTPGFISQPIPAMGGISTAPSTVEMYVNDVLRQVSTVPTGPFTIDNLPSLTGSGDVRMVVRDVLGREMVIEQSFFTSPRLLAPGLNDWSVEVGQLRNDIGIDSNDYGPAFASATWRRGYSNRATLEGRTEATPNLRTLGGGIISVLPSRMLGQLALATSRGEEQGQEMNGNLWLAGLERQALRSTIAIQAQGATINFRQLGQSSTTTPVKLQISGNWSYATSKLGVFGLGAASITRHDDTRISTLSGNYSRRIANHSTLSLAASRAINGGSGTSFSLFFAMPLERSRMVSATINSRDGQHDYYLTAMQNPTYESKLGWRALAGHQQERARGEAGAYYTGRYGRVSGDLSASPDHNAVRLGAMGGLVVADRSLFATQFNDQSFAVAELEGQGNIGVGIGANMLTSTNAAGKTVVPRLIPYHNNAIRIDPNDLPISAEVDSIEQNAVPAWRSAVKVVFPVRGGRGALLRVVLDDGEAAPAGATVRIIGSEEDFYVARRGEVFVTGLEATNTLLLHWKGQECKFDLALPPETPDEIPRLGPLTCTGVVR